MLERLVTGPGIGIQDEANGIRCAVGDQGGMEIGVRPHLAAPDPNAACANGDCSGDIRIWPVSDDPGSFKRCAAPVGHGPEYPRVGLREADQSRDAYCVDEFVETARPDLLDLSGAAIRGDPDLVSGFPQELRACDRLGVAGAAPQLIAPVKLDKVGDRRAQGEARTDFLEEPVARSHPVAVRRPKHFQGRLGIELSILDEGLSPLSEEPVSVDQRVIEVENDQAPRCGLRHEWLPRRRQFQVAAVCS